VIVTGTRKDRGNLNVPCLALLPEGSVRKGRSATFGKDDVPKLGEPVYDGKDDAFSDQDPEDISRNPATILSWVKKLVGFVRGTVESAQIRVRGRIEILTVKVLGCVRYISQCNVQTDGENADGEVKPWYWSNEGQQNLG